jgi:hypothetical protein
MNRAKYLAVVATIVLGITGSAFAEVEGWGSESPATHTMMSCCSNAKTCSGTTTPTSAPSARKGQPDYSRNPYWEPRDESYVNSNLR